MSDTFPYVGTESYIINECEDYLKISWKKQVVSEQIKEGLRKLLTLMRTSGKAKLLSDVSSCDSSWSSSNEWIVNHWLPEALSLGLQKTSFLISDNLIQKVSVDNLFSKLKRKQSFIGRFFKIFSKEKEALEWLSS